MISVAEAIQIVRQPTRSLPSERVKLHDALHRVLAEDIVPEVRDELSDRIQRERLDNVAVKLGTADNPMLPAASFDRVFLVHMYHEVTSPYAFLWHLREAAKNPTRSVPSIPHAMRVPSADHAGGAVQVNRSG